jgi:hypothetical protein
VSSNLARSKELTVQKDAAQWLIIIIIIIMLPNQAIASMPSAPRPSGSEGKGSTAPLCLQLLRSG